MKLVLSNNKGEVNKFQTMSYILIFSALMIGIGVLLLGNLSDVYCASQPNTTNFTINSFEPGDVASSLLLFNAGGGDNNTHYWSFPNGALAHFGYVNLTGNSREGWSARTEIEYDGLNSLGAYIELITANGTANNLFSFYRSDADVVRFNYMNTTGQWQTPETVTGSSRGFGIDADYHETNKEFYVTYQNGAANLEAANGTSGSWTTTTVDAGANTGTWTSILADVDGGQAHVAYRSETSSALKYAYQDGTGTWNPTFVNTTGNTGWYPELFYDGDSSPTEFIIFTIEITGGTLDYVNGSNGTGWSNAISLDASGNVLSEDFGACNTSNKYHLFYVRSDNNLYYLSTFGNMTVNETATQIYNPAWLVGGEVDVYCDAGAAYVAMVDATNDQIYYGVFNTTDQTWNTTPYVADNGTLPTAGYLSITQAGSDERDAKLAFQIDDLFDGAYYREIVSDYPNDVCLDVNNDGSCEYTSGGALDSNVITGNLAAALNTGLAACVTDPCNITLSLNSTSIGTVLLHNANASYNTTTAGVCNSQKAADGTNSAIDALGEFGTWFAIIGIVIVAAAVVLIFKGFNGGV